MSFCSRENVGMLSKTYAGRKLWIVGCGPTLDDVDLNRMKNGPVWCLNAAITLFTKNRNAWWFLRDQRAFFECTPRLKDWRVWNIVTHTRLIAQMLSHGLGRKGMDARVLEYGWHTVEHRRTVLEDALQVADKVGFAETYLVGVDHAVRNFKPYAKPLLWKTCHFYRWDRAEKEGRKMKPVSGPLTRMSQIMCELVPRLKMKVYNTSEVYPSDAFERIGYDEAIKRFERDYR